MHNNIREQILEAVEKWKHAQTCRKLYGADMPQTAQAIDKCFDILSVLLPQIESLSIVKQENELKVLASEDLSEDITLNAVAILEDFNRLYIYSLTIHSGASREELSALFDIMNIDEEEAKKRGGLKDILKKNGVVHIELDHMRFELLKEDEHKEQGNITAGEDVQDKGAGTAGSGGSGKGSGIAGPGSGGEGAAGRKGPRTYDLSSGAGRGGAGEGGSSGTGAGTGAGAGSGEGSLLSPAEKELFDSSWQGYLEGNIGRENFSSFADHFVEFARQSPEYLAGVVGEMMQKQKEVEKFLANLEKKLFDLGFPEKAIDTLKKKLKAGRQVTISEDELLRLRKIEAKFEYSVNERLEESIHTIDKIKARLSDEQERSDAILRQVCQGSVTLDEKGKILALNPVAEKALGISSKKACGRTLEAVLKEHHMLSIVDNWQSETEEFIPKQVKVQSMDDVTLDTIRESSVVLEDGKGRPVGVVSSLQDIVGHQEMKSFRQDLLDVLGHDLRVPVLAAKHSIKRICEDEKILENIGEDGRKFVEICLKSVESTEKMIKKILDVRQIETGKIVLKKEKSDINQVIYDVVASLDQWAQGKNIDIQVDGGKVPVLYMDPERIYQVVMNLAGNAVKFTPENGVIKIISKTVSIDKMDFVEVSVSDTGIGIDKNDLQRIFTKYEQVSLVSPKGKSGLGLGLALCRMLVELHGGIIWAESEKNKGSVFSFRLPVE